jgi:hypothetical protein
MVAVSDLRDAQPLAHFCPAGHLRGGRLLGGTSGRRARLPVTGFGYIAAATITEVGDD